MAYLGFCRSVKLLGRSASHPRPLLGISFPSTGRHTSTDSKNKFYELRTYSIQPSKFGEFIKLTNENLHLRLAHSRLIGYWTTELGGLNEVVHLWEYDSYFQRTNVRKALSKDKTWIETYLSKASTMMIKQDNVVIYPLPWCPLNFEPDKNSNVYQLVCDSIFSGRIPQWEHRILQGWDARLKYSKPVGIWKSHYGPLNNVYQLWIYDNLDHQKQVEDDAMGDEEWKETYRDTALLTQSSWSKGLVPVDISPMK